MRNRYFLIILTLIIPICIQAQSWKRSRAEAILSLGATNFLGDLGGANAVGTNGFKDFDLKATRPVFNFGYAYRFTQFSGLQMEIAYARLYGSDKYTEEYFRGNRELKFRSPVWQFTGKYFINLTKQRPGHIYNLRGVRGMKNVQIISYLFTGVGVMWFNPRGQGPDGSWYSLRPLNTEGQGVYETRKKYYPVQVVIPVGFGFKWLVDRNWFVGIEYTLHKTFTDYIDDVSTTYPGYALMQQEKGDLAAYFSNPAKGKPNSGHTLANMQRGDPSDHDSYMYAMMSVRYRIPYSKRFLSIPKF